ncbi:MAG: prepilin-type N-terminal cleavage/methylation domain-containing protein [Opitutaceae bacterium]|jgi:prepilin-type N-terminal cleavage/methylation domain-containing protein|nr:prepilin-type N-terminal cleavage/methylation domain-containing protein [Opitutaceae bacterium]
MNTTTTHNPDIPETRVRIIEKAAFTLIELLAVITIIGILAAIIIPVVGKVRENAKRVKVLGNLRSCYTMHQLYANDNKDTIIPANDNVLRQESGLSVFSWCESLYHYGYVDGSIPLKSWETAASSAYRCLQIPGAKVFNNPSTTECYAKKGITLAQIPTFMRNGMIGPDANRATAGRAAKFVNLASPSRTFLITDGCNQGGTSRWIFNHITTNATYLDPLPGFQGEKRFVTFADGHTTLMPQAEVKSLWQNDTIFKNGQ